MNLNVNYENIRGDPSGFAPFNLPSHAPDELTPIHRGNKKEWVAFNGTEDELLKQVYDIIEEDRPWLYKQ